MVCFCISKCSAVLSSVIAPPKEHVSLFQGSFQVGQGKNPFHLIQTPWGDFELSENMEISNPNNIVTIWLKSQLVVDGQAAFIFSTHAHRFSPRTVIYRLNCEIFGIFAVSNCEIFGKTSKHCEIFSILSILNCEIFGKINNFVARKEP